MRDNPGVIAPPPLIYAAGLLAGLALDALGHVRFVPVRVDLPALLLVATGTLFGVWALVAMRRARTSPLPEHPTTAIVTDGPFAFSRNPIYLGFTLIYSGFALWRDSLWTVGLLVVVLAVMHYGVITREERYLHAKFGEVYAVYRAKVRRWL